MAPLMAFPAELLAGLLTAEQVPRFRVLDIAAGHGLYGIAIAKRYARAEIVAVDWPNVLEVARENARTAGVSDRFCTIAGSAFEVDYGDGYDLALLVNFLHHFDVATIEETPRKVCESLTARGQAAILEFIPDEDRISPRVPAAFSLMMLTVTPCGDAYTYSEYERLLRRAGSSFMRSPQPASYLIAFQSSRTPMWILATWCAWQAWAPSSAGVRKRKRGGSIRLASSGRHWERWKRVKRNPRRIVA